MDCKAWSIYCARVNANITAEGNYCIVGYVDINTWQIPKAYQQSVRLMIVSAFTERVFTG